MNSITKGEFVSRVIGEMNAISKDDRISRRLVLSIGMNKAKTYMSQKLKDRTLHRESNLFTPVDCLPMKRIRKVDCDVVEFKRYDVLMRSTSKLPGLIFSRYGSSVTRVVSLDDLGILFRETDMYDLAIRSKRKNSSHDPVFIIHDDYLYIPDYEIELVKVDAISLTPTEFENLSSCIDRERCVSAWDEPFICPDKILEPIIKETAMEVATKLKQIPKDENPNMDNNQKTTTE